MTLLQAVRQVLVEADLYFGWGEREQVDLQQ